MAADDALIQAMLDSSVDGFKLPKKFPALNLEATS